jgi:hypothetical protein
MLATAAKLSRALAAPFDVLLSELALEVQLEALLQVTQYPLPASAGTWAGGFWQIVSIKETNNFKSHRSSRWPFYCVPIISRSLHVGKFILSPLRAPKPRFYVRVLFLQVHRILGFPPWTRRDQATGIASAPASRQFRSADVAAARYHSPHGSAPSNFFKE